MTTVEALTDIYNRIQYGTKSAGEVFAVRDSVAQELIASGKARPYYYETKVITPEVKPLTAQPFRDVPPPDEKPPALATLERAVRAVSDVPAPRTPGRVERPKRKRPRTR